MAIDRYNSADYDGGGDCSASYINCKNTVSRKENYCRISETLRTTRSPKRAFLLDDRFSQEKAGF